MKREWILRERCVRRKRDKWALFLACLVVSLCTGCPPSVPDFSGTIDVRMPFRPNVCAGGGEMGHCVVDLFGGNTVFLYPLIPGGFPMVVTATSNGTDGVRRVQLFECGTPTAGNAKGGSPGDMHGCPAGTEPPVLITEANGDPNNLHNSLALQYTFDIHKGEQLRTQKLEPSIKAAPVMA